MEFTWLEIAATILFTVFFTVLLKISFTSKNNVTSQTKRVMIVIAHPDDECMFFGPTITHYTSQNKSSVYLLCLSSGNFYGKGSIRQKELWESCQTLGIPSENITLCKFDSLPDSPKDKWPTAVTSKIIQHHVNSLDINMVISFDSLGVSRHINHISIYKALNHSVQEKKFNNGCEVLLLETTTTLRKYIFFLDILFSLFFSKEIITASYTQYKTIKAAMKCHASQYVWFRILYIHFSRYMLINSYTRLKVK